MPHSPAVSLLQTIARDLELVTGLDVPQAFKRLHIGLGDRNAIELVNSRQHALSLHEAGGITLLYSGDPRNLHQRELFRALEQAGVFEGFDAKPYGHEGKTYFLYLGHDHLRMLMHVERILSAAYTVIPPGQCHAKLYMLTGPAEAPLRIMEP